MKQSLRLGQVRGRPVGAHWSVGLILVIIAEVLAVSVLPAAYPHEQPAVYWTVAVVAALVFLASAAGPRARACAGGDPERGEGQIHHLVDARRGDRVRGRTANGRRRLPDRPGRAAGQPGRGALCYGVAAAIHAASGPAIAVAAAMWLALMNGILGLFNLLPGAPLDGGRVLRAALWRRYGDRGAGRSGRPSGSARFSAWASSRSASSRRSACSFADGLWLALIGSFIITAATTERQTATAEIALAGVRVADVMTPHPDLASGWHSVADFTREAARSRQDAFPVVGFNGELTGIVLTSQLARVPARDRPGLRLGPGSLRSRPATEPPRMTRPPRWPPGCRSVAR